MTYNIFLVEDEIVTREGIRDSVAWESAGYLFCGEAPDGEIALPLIRQSQPEVVITDIRMPFMDGLQLSRVLRAEFPKIKIIILSGHDEFKYAQEAIQIGVTEYLLKPLSAQHLIEVLKRVAGQIDQERHLGAAHPSPQTVPPDQTIIIKPHTAVIEQLLRSGLQSDIPHAIQSYLQPMASQQNPSRAQVEYVLTDALLTIAHGIHDIGGETAHSVPNVQDIPRMASQIAHLDQIIPVIAHALEHALDYRDRHTDHQHMLIERARNYMLTHYDNPNLSLSDVASYVMLSPSYFSAMFSNAVGETFIEYLTGVRVGRAIELLRTTALTSSEIALRVGYQNPRYFFSVFRKITGQSPTAFRHTR